MEQECHSFLWGDDGNSGHDLSFFAEKPRPSWVWAVLVSVLEYGCECWRLDF